MTRFMTAWHISGLIRGQAGGMCGQQGAAAVELVWVAGEARHRIAGLWRFWPLVEQNNVVHNTKSVVTQ
jgi:hypothetical protein